MQIEIFHDTACPWCRIGKRHLQLALAQWQGEAVEVRYRSFFLQPDLPPEGADFLQVMRSKGGGSLPLEAFFDAPRQRGAEVGLAFHFDKITRAPNTLLSHRLIAITPPEQQPAVLEAIYAAYFEHGQDIGSLDTLVELAAGQGLDPAWVRQQLEGEAGLEAVQADAAWARQAGINGVPFFLLNGRYAFSGAQPPEVITNILQQVASGQVQVES